MLQAPVRPEDAEKITPSELEKAAMPPAISVATETHVELKNDFDDASKQALQKFFKLETIHNNNPKAESSFVNSSELTRSERLKIANLLLDNGVISYANKLGIQQLLPKLQNQVAAANMIKVEDYKMLSELLSYYLEPAELMKFQIKSQRQSIENTSANSEQSEQIQAVIQPEPAKEISSAELRKTELRTASQVYKKMRLLLYKLANTSTGNESLMLSGDEVKMLAKFQNNDGLGYSQIQTSDTSPNAKTQVNITLTGLRSAIKGMETQYKGMRLNFQQYANKNDIRIDNTESQTPPTQDAIRRNLNSLDEAKITELRLAKNLLQKLNKARSNNDVVSLLLTNEEVLLINSTSQKADSKHADAFVQILKQFTNKNNLLTIPANIKLTLMENLAGHIRDELGISKVNLPNQR